MTAHPTNAAGWTRVAACCALLAAAVLPGCGRLFDAYANPVGPDIEALRQVDPIDLREHSQTEPVTVQEAAEEAIERIVEPPEAPATLSIGLADVRAAALANNLDLQVELVEPSIAASIVDEEEARFEAVFGASYRRSITDSPTEFETQSSQATLDQWEVGFDLPLVTGGAASVSMPLSRSDTNNEFSLLNPAFDADVRFSISQPLLRGGGIKANTHAIRVARHQEKIANARTKLEAIRILANADRAYWLLYAARRELEVRQQQYELAVRQLEQARRMVEAGETAAIEITRAESGVAERLEAIIVAETNLKRQQRDLKRIMNRPELPIRSATVIITATDAEPVRLELDPADLSELAVANRMEMLELELQLAIDASTIDLERNAALPLFTVDYIYNFNGLGSSFGRAFDQIGERSFADWSLGLNAEIPIGNEAAKARVSQAILRRLQRLSTKSQRRQAIVQEVHDAVDVLEQDWQRILAARQEAILAGRTYEAEQRQFEVGLRTSTDVLDAAARLADAQSREVRALADYEIARVDLAFGTGTLLGHDRVHWAPRDLQEAPAPDAP